MKRIFIGQYRKVVAPYNEYYIKIIKKITTNNHFLIKASIEHAGIVLPCTTCPYYNRCRKDLHYGCRPKWFLEKYTKPVSKLEILLKRLDKIL